MLSKRDSSPAKHPSIERWTAALDEFESSPQGKAKCTARLGPDTVLGVDGKRPPNHNVVLITTSLSTMKTVTAAEANRRFSELLRAVAAGETVEVVSRGRPVARISSVDANRATREAARIALLRRLRAQRSTGARNWRRDELYENDR